MLQSLFYYILSPFISIYNIFALPHPWIGEEPEQEAMYTSVQVPDAPNNLMNEAYLVVCKNKEKEKEAHHLVMIDFLGETNVDYICGFSLHLSAIPATGKLNLIQKYAAIPRANMHTVFPLGKVTGACALNIPVPYTKDDCWDSLNTCIYETNRANAACFKEIKRRTGKELWSTELNCQKYAKDIVTIVLGLQWPAQVEVNYSHPSLQECK